MNNIVSPFVFPKIILSDDFSVEYKNISEFTQGGPMVGNIYVSNIGLVTNSRFGGPLIVHKDFIVVPKLTSSFFKGPCFILTIINAWSGKEETIGFKHNLILLNYIKDSIIYFYTDLKNSKLNSIRCTYFE